MTAILLTAGIGRRLWPLTAEHPKCLLPLPLAGGCTLIRLVMALELAGVDRLVCVVGHLRGQIRQALDAVCFRLSIRLVVNDRYSSGSIFSLGAARDFLDDDVLILDADVLLPLFLVSRLVQSSLPNACLLDPQSTSRGEEMMLMTRGDRVLSVGREVEQGSWDLVGESLGLAKFDRSAARTLRDSVSAAIGARCSRADYEVAYRPVFDSHDVGFLSAAGEPWMEIDTSEDLAMAVKSIAPRIADLELREAVALATASRASKLERR